MWQLILILIASFLAGMALGAFYFWALWRSVRRLAERRAHSILLGYLFRLSIILGGFFLIMGGHWERLVSALAGFLVIRALLVRRWGDRRVENL